MQPNVLVVEDEPINQERLVETLAEEGYGVTASSSGNEAWERLLESGSAFDVILLDRMMPDMDGIEILRRVKSREGTEHIPVIMQTAMTADADVAEGLRAGAFYYLTKPFSADTLLAIVGAAVEDRRKHEELLREAKRIGQSFGCLSQAIFAIRTPEEARNLASLAANAAPDPARVVLGLCELMLNAVEHGNLAIGYAEKTALIERGELHEEIERRLVAPQFAARKVQLEICRGVDGVRFAIRDEGAGFDWSRYLELAPERAFDTHGRGIAMSRMLSFDRVEYQGAGNEVVAWVALKPD